SLIVGGHEVRLYGMDAMEHHQTCRRDDAEWRCGAEATQAMRGLAETKHASCAPRERDRYGRTVAVCRRDDVDLGEHMVTMGLAVSLGAYPEAERLAREARRGIWGATATFERPGAWRARNSRGIGGDAGP